MGRFSDFWATIGPRLRLPAPFLDDPLSDLEPLSLVERNGAGWQLTGAAELRLGPALRELDVACLETQGGAEVPRGARPKPRIEEGRRKRRRNQATLISALMMFRRFERALRYALHEENFAAILAAALTLIGVGTLAYTLGEGWSVVDGFYFAVATLTTSSIADSELVLTSSWSKVFTAFYVLVGIGILVEVARQLGVALIEIRRQDHAAKAAAKAAKHPAERG